MTYSRSTRVSNVNVRSIRPVVEVQALRRQIIAETQQARKKNSLKHDAVVSAADVQRSLKRTDHRLLLEASAERSTDCDPCVCEDLCNGHYPASIPPRLRERFSASSYLVARSSVEPHGVSRVSCHAKPFSLDSSIGAILCVHRSVQPFE